MIKKQKETITMRPQKRNKWVIKELEKEKKQTNSPSLSNTMETIIINYFNDKNRPQ